MSDPIKHECGLAFIRLRKPFSYYHQKYSTVLWGLNKLYLLMEKQHNRGQDGAGIATVKLDVEPGYPFMNRLRSNAPQAIADIFQSAEAHGVAAGIHGFSVANCLHYLEMGARFLAFSSELSLFLHASRTGLAEIRKAAER